MLIKSNQRTIVCRDCKRTILLFEGYELIIVDYVFPPQRYTRICADCYNHLRKLNAAPVKIDLESINSDKTAREARMAMFDKATKRAL